MSDRKRKRSSKRSIKLPPSLLERYESIELLGRGGFGKVIRANDKKMDREVAIKLLAGNIDQPEAVKRFQDEAKVTSRLEHENVVKVFDFGVDPSGQAYIVYEYVEGENLAEYLGRSKRIRLGTLLTWAAEVAGALASSHEAGIVHRDVKPENVLIRHGRDPVLIDFGLAWKEQSEGFTSGGYIMGTPGYIAPEIWYGNRPTPAADQFAWAAVLYRALYGKRIYPGRTPKEITDFLKKNQPGGEVETPKGIPLALTPVLLRALRRDPDERYPDMQAFEEAIREVIAGGTPEQVDRDVETRVLRTLEPSRKMTGIRPVLGAVLPDSPRRVVPLVVGACFLAAIAWLLPWGGLPGSPPPTPTAPAAPSAKEKARETMDRNLADLLELLDEDSKLPPPESTGPHVRRRRKKLLDARFQLKWRRYGDNMLAWARTPGAGGDPQVLERHARWAPHILADFRILFHKVEGAFGVMGWGRKDEVKQLALKVHRAWESFLPEVRRLVRNLSRDRVFEREWGLVLAGDLARLSQSDEMESLAEKALNRVRAGEQDAARALRLVLRIMSGVSDGSPFPPGRARTTFRRLLEHSLTADPVLPPREYFRVMCVSLVEYYRLLFVSTREVSPENAAALDKLLDWLEQHRDEVDELEREHLRQIAGKCVLLFEERMGPPEALRRRNQRLRRLSGS